MVGAAGLGILIGLLIWMIVRDAPAHAAPMTSRLKSTLREDLRILVKNPIAWVNGIYSGLMFTILSVFVALWAIPFVQIAYHVTLTESTVLCNLVFVGVVIGGPIIGWLDGRVKNRRKLLAFFTMASAILLSVLIYVPSLSLVTIIFLMVLLGIFACTYILTFAIANEIVPSHMRGTSIGFTNALSMVTAPLLQPLVGLVLHLVAHHSTTGVESYTAHNYQLALTLLPVSILISALLCKWMPLRKF
jgi:MFS family permease